MKYMLDTNICIYAIKNKPATVSQRLQEHSELGLCISTITLAELTHGVYKSIHKEKNMDALLKIFVENRDFTLTYKSKEHQ